MDKDFCPECGTEFLSCCHNDIEISREEIARMLKKLNYAIFSTTIDGMCEMLKELGVEVVNE